MYLSEYHHPTYSVLISPPPPPFRTIPTPSSCQPGVHCPHVNRVLVQEQSPVVHLRDRFPWEKAPSSLIVSRQTSMTAHRYLWFHRERASQWKQNKHGNSRKPGSCSLNHGKCCDHVGRLQEFWDCWNCSQERFVRGLFRPLSLRNQHAG